MRRLLTWLPEIVLGLLAVAMAMLLVPTVAARAAAQSQERECRSHLRAIYQAIQRYRADHHGEYPPRLVAPSRLGPNEQPMPTLVPRYLSADQLICPADPSRGEKPGWSAWFSYAYELYQLGSPNLEVRHRVKTDLIDRFGPGLYLVQCGSFHPNGPIGFLTLHADGRIYREFVREDDPQRKVRMSLWGLQGGDMSHRSLTPSAGGSLPSTQGGASTPPQNNGR